MRNQPDASDAPQDDSASADASTGTGPTQIEFAGVTMHAANPFAAHTSFVPQSMIENAR